MAIFFKCSTMVRLKSEGFAYFLLSWTFAFSGTVQMIHVQSLTLEAVFTSFTHIKSEFVTCAHKRNFTKS